METEELLLQQQKKVVSVFNERGATKKHALPKNPPRAQQQRAVHPSSLPIAHSNRELFALNYRYTVLHRSKARKIRYIILIQQYQHHPRFITA